MRLAFAICLGVSSLFCNFSAKADPAEQSLPAEDPCPVGDKSFFSERWICSLNRYLDETLKRENYRTRIFLLSDKKAANELRAFVAQDGDEVCDYLRSENTSLVFRDLARIYRFLPAVTAEDEAKAIREIDEFFDKRGFWRCESVALEEKEGLNVYWHIYYLYQMEGRTKRALAIGTHTTWKSQRR